MNKNLVILVLLCLSIFSLTSCTEQKIDDVEKDKPVKAEKLVEEARIVSINIEEKDETGYGNEEKKGIWVKLQYILSEDEDYVYTIEEDKAHKKTVKIKAISGNEALVDGLKSGDMLIISGYSKLSEGYPVKIMNGEK